MSRCRNYWVYSLGLGIAWAIVLIVVYAANRATAHIVLLAFLGFVISWTSTTIARYVSSPARRWQTAPKQPGTSAN